MEAAAPQSCIRCRFAREEQPGFAAARELRVTPPHALCHAFITHTLDAGVALREVQDAVGHADPRTTRRYDRVRGSLDRHPGYALASYLAE